MNIRQSEGIGKDMTKDIDDSDKLLKTKVSVSLVVVVFPHLWLCSSISQRKKNGDFEVKNLEKMFTLVWIVFLGGTCWQHTEENGQAEGREERVDKGTGRDGNIGARGTELC